MKMFLEEWEHHVKVFFSGVGTQFPYVLCILTTGLHYARCLTWHIFEAADGATGGGA